MSVSLTGQGAQRPGVRRPSQPRRTLFPDLSPGRTFDADRPPSPEAPTSSDVPRRTLRVILEIDGSPHALSFVDPLPGSDAPTVYRLRARDGSEARVAPLEDGPTCDCQGFSPEVGCIHVRALIAARIMPALGWSIADAGRPARAGVGR